MSDLHEVPERYGLPMGDLIVCLLGAFVLALAAWALVLGLFAGANYGLTYFQLTLPNLAASALSLGSKTISILAGLLAGLLGFRFLARLP